MRKSIIFSPHWPTESFGLAPMLHHEVAVVRLIQPFCSPQPYATSRKSAGRV
jgi:hypothetical protein